MISFLSRQSLPRFRVVQAASELKSLLRPFERDLVLQLGRVGVSETDAADRIGDFLERPLLTFVPDKENDVRDRLENLLRIEGAFDPHLLPVLGLWVADVLLSGRDGTSTPTIRKEWRTFLLRLPRAEKAVYMNAFREVGSYGYDLLDPQVEPSDSLSEDRESVSAPLRAIAKAATEEELRAISVADRGDQAESHYEKLVEVIWKRGCIVSPDDSWTPLETIQLCSHTPGNAGYLVAFVVLLVTSIANGDNYSDIEFRWERQYSELGDLPPHLRDPILAGIRHIYESDAEWEPMPWRNRKPFDRAMLIPPARSV